MASTYTSLLRLEKQANGENDSSWGTKLNTVLDLVDAAIAGRAAVTHSDAASYTLTTANSSSDEARQMIVDVSGALTAARNTVVPTSSKLYCYKNGTSGGYATTVKTSGGTGISVPNGKRTMLACDGTNVVSAIDYILSLTAGTLGVRSSGAAFDLQLASSEVLTANRALSVVLGDAARTLTLSASGTASMLDVEDQALTGGAIVTSKSLGTVSSGTTTPDPGDRPLQHYTNGGAHTLGVSSNAGSIVLDITNNASAGAITTSGFTKVVGDAFTTTNGHKFRCSITIGNGGSLLQVQALQ